jgi:hypothetical protein
MQSILRPLQLEQKDLASSRRKGSTNQPISLDEVPSLRKKRTQFSFQNVTFFRHIPWKEYFFHLPVLFLGLIGLGGVIFIFGWVEPSSIQHMYVPNSYAPLLLTVAAGTFFCGSYLFLNSRRGLLTSVVITSILFLKLQQVLTWTLVVIILGVALGAEIISLVLIAVLHPLTLRFSFPKFQRPARSVDLVKSKDESPKPRPRKHGRKRKHHFFGK